MKFEQNKPIDSLTEITFMSILDSEELKVSIEAVSGDYSAIDISGFGEEYGEYLIELFCRSFVIDHPDCDPLDFAKAITYVLLVAVEILTSKTDFNNLEVISKVRIFPEDFVTPKIISYALLLIK